MHRHKPHDHHHSGSAKATPKEPIHWIDRLRNSMPTREVLSAHPWLKPVAIHVLDPKLWRLQHEAVARGVAVGMFWAFVIPFGQVLASTVHCIWWRANIPVAALVTAITNPLTIGFWLWLAYQLGSVLLGAPSTMPTPQGSGVIDWLAAYGWPTVLGMGLFATGGAAAGYVLVRLVWRLRVGIRRRRTNAR
jgi:uncharacterized protein (DUF2062 family)